MDPDASLKEQLGLAEAILRDGECGTYKPDAHDVARLAELVLALDEWLSNAGFLPARWGQP